MAGSITGPAVVFKSIVMKIRNLTWLLLALLAVSCQNSSSDEEKTVLNVITFNIRNNNPNDGINIWNNRKEMAADVFNDYGIDIAGLQEVKKQQLDDLNGLLPGYAYVGVGRVDGKTAGEYCPIYYRKEKLALLESGTQWLSETPEVVGSKGWDAALPRIFTWGKFKNIKDGKVFYFINTHFDHRGEEARVQSSSLLLRKAEELAGGDFPVIITGDFNYTRDKEGYGIMTRSGDPLSFHDSRDISRIPFTGRPHSSNGFEEREVSKIIDYVFVNDGIEVEEYDILTIKKDSVYVSDHFPVMSILSL
jgi:endonuclease/exonuclease/phosphatase family metal-dependent hydrolase